MRAYFFTNFYLSPIQHGIQSAHVLHEMFRKYNNAPMLNHYDTLCDWADNHKTIIVKNGGETNTMLRIKELCGKMNLPSAYFNEPSLDGALTCVGIIVPDRFYDRTVSNRFCESWKRTKIENEFIDLLESTRLAQ
jgi:hypothetical protein